jgi:hypothetical protein
VTTIDNTHAILNRIDELTGGQVQLSWPLGETLAAASAGDTEKAALAYVAKRDKYRHAAPAKLVDWAIDELTRNETKRPPEALYAGAHADGQGGHATHASSTRTLPKYTGIPVVRMFAVATMFNSEHQERFCAEIGFRETDEEIVLHTWDEVVLDYFRRFHVSLQKEWGKPVRFEVDELDSPAGGR